MLTIMKDFCFTFILIVLLNGTPARSFDKAEFIHHVRSDGLERIPTTYAQCGNVNLHENNDLCMHGIVNDSVPILIFINMFLLCDR